MGGGGVDAANAGIIGGVVVGAAVLFIMAMVVYRNKSRDEQASLADDVDRITIEAEAARPQPTPVDQASMSSGVNDMSMVEAPASMVTDVQEKIIEATCSWLGPFAPVAEHSSRERETRTPRYVVAPGKLNALGCSLRRQSA